MSVIKHVLFQGLNILMSFIINTLLQEKECNKQIKTIKIYEQRNFDLKHVINIYRILLL